MTSARPARLALILTAGALAFTLTGCGGGSAADESAPPAASAASEASAVAEEPAEEPADEAPAESAAPATGTAVLTDGEAPAERTITITADALSPATLTIAVGDTVTFKAGDDAVYAVEVGELESASVSGGLIETFQFPEAGEYPVVEIISGNSAVIVVE